MHDFPFPYTRKTGRKQVTTINFKKKAVYTPHKSNREYINLNKMQMGNLI